MGVHKCEGCPDLGVVGLAVDIVKVDSLLIRKISIRHFLRDIENYFQEITPIYLEPCHFFLFEIPVVVANGLFMVIKSPSVNKESIGYNKFLVFWL